MPAKSAVLGGMVRVSRYLSLLGLLGLAGIGGIFKQEYLCLSALSLLSYLNFFRFFAYFRVPCTQDEGRRIWLVTIVAVLPAFLIALRIHPALGFLGFLGFLGLTLPDPKRSDVA